MTDARNSLYRFLPTLNRDKRGGTVAHIHDVIRSAIVRLEFAPGEFIDKSALCNRLGVSRFPVSEALGRLADEGFVEILPQRGTRVTRINLADCQEAMFIRNALEIDTVRAIAPRGDARLLAALKRNLRDAEHAMKHDDRVRFHELDIELHDLLFDALGFERVKSTVYAARAKIDRMRLFVCTPERQLSTHAEHEKIVDALASRDAEAAAAAMHDHLSMVTAVFVSFSEMYPDAFERRPADVEAA
ncbi:MAG: GntR family transcriptional regulator [Pseudorhodoplanes sp.]|nr:GntR family transcriptional regulator [Pseudorhodoplanes sp.]